MPSKSVKDYSRDTKARAAFILAQKVREMTAAERKTAWRPNPGAQTVALFSKADELFYGGAAGGGKTDLLIGVAATMQYKSIIFRRQFPQLKDIIARSREMYTIYPSAKYNKQDHIWYLPFGRTLEYGAMPLLDDREKFQGRPHDGKLFDEITQFLPEQYIYQLGWNRTTRPGQRYRAICTGNPPTNPDGEWIIEYWRPWLDKQYENPAKPGEMRWFATVAGISVEVEGPEPFISGNQKIEPRSRSYVPARLIDNPHLAHTGYAAVVNAMPEPLRSLLLFGFEAELPPEIDPWQVVPTEFLDVSAAAWRRVQAPSTYPTSVGVDTARGGADRTVIAVKHGNYIAPLHVFAGTETPNGDIAAARVVEALGFDASILDRGVSAAASISRVPINVDIIGANGSATYDALRRAGFNAYAVHGNMPSQRLIRERTLKTQNLRAEAYWIGIREAMDPLHAVEGLLIPDDRELRSEIAATRWFLSDRGQIMLVPKDKIELRLGKSPDKADAVALACIDMVARGAPPPPSSTGGRSLGNQSVPIEPSSRAYGVEVNPGIEGSFAHANSGEAAVYNGHEELIYVEGIGMVPESALERIADQFSATSRIKRNL